MRDQLSANFYRDEFACKCGCGFDKVDPRLVKVLQEIRDWFKRPVRVDSGCRCKAHNDATPNAAPNSKHLLGIAADIVVKDVPAASVQRFIESRYPDTFGVGKYNSFTHIDIRKSKARW